MSAIRKGSPPPVNIDDVFMPDIGYFIHRNCTPEWRIVRQAFPAWDITYVQSGSAEYVINGHKYRLSAGDLMCMPKDSVRLAHTFADDLMTCYAVNFLLKDLSGKDAGLPFPLISHIGEQKDIINLFEELSFAWMERRPGYSMQARGLFTLILHRLYEILVFNDTSGVADFRIKKITRYIMRHYPEKLTVKQLAELVDLNPVYFGALFKKETGLAFNHYLDRIRIQNAKNILKSGEYKTVDVAAQVGYTDVFCFYKKFRQAAGTSPSQFVSRINPLDEKNEKDEKMDDTQTEKI